VRVLSRSFASAGVCAGLFALVLVGGHVGGYVGARVGAQGPVMPLPVTPPGPPQVIVPPIPGPTPAPVDPDSVPDDLKPIFTIKATIAGEVQAGEIVTLPVGRLLVLTVEGLPSEARPAVTWAMNAKCVDVSVREDGYYVTFTAPVDGNWLFTAAVNNPEPAGPPLVAQRWVVVGHGPRPPPGPMPPEPPGPEPEPAPPTPQVGKRLIVIVSESGKHDGAFSRLLVNMRDGSAADYLKSKGHRFDWLDVDQLKADDPWKSHVEGMTLPAAFYIDVTTNTVVHRESLSKTTTADNVIETLKRNGG